MDREQIHVHGRFPYRDAPGLEESYYSYRQDICPHCGSIQQILFADVVSNINEYGRFLSGDLRFGTMVRGRCMICGYERPLSFRMIREV